MEKHADAPPDLCPAQPFTEVPFSEVLLWEREIDWCQRRGWQPEPCTAPGEARCEVGNDG